VDEELLEEWPIWRLVESRIVSLTEIESTWSLDDVLRANTVLDIKAKIEEATIAK
jgi:hypothetical protein